MSKKLLLRWVFWKYRSSEKGGSECLPPGLLRPKEMTLWNSSQVNLLERTEHYASPWADLKKDSDDSKGNDETTEVTIEANKVPDPTKKRMAEEIQPTFPSTSTSAFKAKLLVGPGLLRRKHWPQPSSENSGFALPHRFLVHEEGVSPPIVLQFGSGHYENVVDFDEHKLEGKTENHPNKTHLRGGAASTASLPMPSHEATPKIAYV